MQFRAKYFNAFNREMYFNFFRTCTWSGRTAHAGSIGMGVILEGVTSNVSTQNSDGSLFLRCRNRFAQFDSGQISGFVRDASQAVISGAMITVVNEGNGEQRQGATNTSGYYVFPNLPVGTYTVTAESAGVKKSAETGIVLNSASKLSIDLTLTVGAVSESLEVKASTSQVQTETGPSRPGRRE